MQNNKKLMLLKLHVGVNSRSGELDKRNVYKKALINSPFNSFKFCN